MAKNSEQWLQHIGSISAEPGCYLFKDKQNRIFYIGKAINLRNRVRQYFTGQDTRQFVGWLTDILESIDTIIVRNDTEALLLERELIRQHQPKYNILLRDDKNFILLRLDTHQKYPHLEIVRRVKNDGARYFGPYPSAIQLRTTVHLINKYFQLRTCSDEVMARRKRPCIQHQMGRCPAPCVFDVPSYSEEVNDVILFLTGHTKEIGERLTQKMWTAAKDEHFELASHIRDQLEAIKVSLAHQVVSLVSQKINQDVLAIQREGPYVEIVRLIIQKGRVLGTRHYSFDHQEFPTGELFYSFVSQLYSTLNPEDIPEQILVNLPLTEDVSALAQAFSERKHKQVKLLWPKLGKLRQLVDIAERNATHALTERMRKQEHQLRALEQLQKRLELPRLPNVIECFDVSILQGTDAVVSQVCFVEGKADKSRYRKFNIKTVEGMDDFAMLYEALSRRFKRGLAENSLPDLILVDGGKGQLSVALAAAKDAGIPISREGLFVVGIAKSRAISGTEHITHSLERLFLPHAKDPLPLYPHTQERYLVERIRDEAHRFAITAHRSKRKKRTLKSELDSIPGIGPARRKALLKHFGSVENIKRASLEELAQVEGIGTKHAEQIHSGLTFAHR